MKVVEYEQENAEQKYAYNNDDEQDSRFLFFGFVDFLLFPGHPSSILALSIEQGALSIQEEAAGPTAMKVRVVVHPDLRRLSQD